MKKLLAIAISVVLLVALWEVRVSIVSVMQWFGNREAVASTAQRLGIWGPAVVFVLLVLQVFLAFIPGQALMVACGYVYGFWAGLLLSWFSLFVGGQAAYFLARWYGRPFAEKWISPEILSKWDRAAEGQGIAFYAASLVLPIFPNDAMCYVAGLGKISSRRFGIANMLGRGAACLLTSAAGAFGGQIPWQGWVVVAALAILGSVIWWIAKNRKPNLSKSARGGSCVEA